TPSSLPNDFLLRRFALADISSRIHGTYSGHYLGVLNLFVGRITAEIRSDSKNSSALVDVRCSASRDSHPAVHLCTTGPLKPKWGRNVTAKRAKISLRCDRGEK